LDTGVEIHHGLCHGISGGIGVKAAPNGQPLLDECRKPSGVGPGAGGGDASAVRIEGKAADGRGMLRSRWMACGFRWEVINLER
jgi:hypothetical protein